MILPVWAFVVSVVVAQAVNEAGTNQREDLTQFLRLRIGASSINWDLESNLDLLRNALHKRVRCTSQTICEACFSSDRIKSLTKGSLPHPSPALGHRQNVTNIYDLVRASVIFLNYFLSFRTSCTPESIHLGYVGSCRTYEQCWTELQKYTSTMRESNLADNLDAVEKILREVKPAYEPDPSQSCFSAENILNEVDERSSDFKNLPHDISTVLLIISHLLSGECIDVGESVTDFLDDLFLHYGDGCERVITESGFTELWNDLQMQRKGKHINHGVQKSSCAHPNTLPREPGNHVGLENKTKYVHNHQTGEIKNRTLMSTAVPVASIFTLDNRNSTTISHENQKPSSTTYNRGNIPPVLNYHENKNLENLSVNNDSASKRTVRHTSLSEEHEHKNLANECLPSNDLLRRFITNENKVITSSEFMQICPALIQQTVSGVCNSRLRSSSVLAFESPDLPKLNDTNIEYEVTKSSANTWYAVLAVTVITLTSLFSLIMIPTLSRPFFKYVKAFFIGLAFGTMSGDVVLHIMPQYLGLHQHDHDHDHGHDHDHDSDEESSLDRLFPTYLQRQLVFLMSMFVLFIAECVFTALSGEETVHHGHSHDMIDVPMKEFDLTTVENPEGTRKRSCFGRIMESLRPSNFCQGITSKALVILLADTVHNFADGIAIAAGYASSYREGFSTTIAVFFHELPHEIGDFVVLMNCGLSYWKAFFFNIISGLSSYIGLGLGVFTAPIFREWLLCITAGLFFFVVMGEMLPDMRLESKKEWKVYIIKLIGSILGIITMISIAMYELSDS